MAMISAFHRSTSVLFLVVVAASTLVVAVAAAVVAVAVVDVALLGHTLYYSWKSDLQRVCMWMIVIFLVLLCQG